MKQVVYILFICGLFAYGCQDITIGYLETRNAVYFPDSMIVKASLDPEEDARQIEFKIPWQSTSIDGVQGTSPVRYSIKSIDSEHPGAVAQFTMRGKGIIELPYNHTVPAGRYVVNVRIEAGEHVQELDSMYTVIVR